VSQSDPCRGASTHMVNGATYALAYDVVKDFEQIALISGNPGIIVAKNAMLANDLAELIGWLKANPGKATAGTAGVGTARHVGGILFQNMTRTRFAIVPYRGAAPAMQDLVAGQIDLIIADSSVASLPQIRAGKIKAYAVTAKVSTLRTGMGFSRPEAHRRALSPDSTPQSFLLWLSPPFPPRLGELGPEVFPREQQTPEALAALQAEIVKWWPIVKAAHRSYWFWRTLIARQSSAISRGVSSAVFGGLTSFLRSSVCTVIRMIGA
jgi:hypothetical protein